jgi:uncharacterized protein (TIGR03083 family)
MTHQPVALIIVSALFPEMRQALLDILKDLSDEQWALPTICDGWSVKDVTLHIVGDDLSIVSRKRDGFFIREKFDNWNDLVTFINQSNNLWVDAARRMSVGVLCDLLRFTGEMVNGYFASLDVHQSGGPVSWAGEGPMPVWLDVAREYTEYWMHHQHICDGLGINSLKDRRHFHPVLDTFMRGLPHSYRDVVAAPGTVITLTLTGSVDDSWHLLREEAGWFLYSDVDDAPDGVPTCTITLPDEVAWRLFTKGMTTEQARSQTTISGDVALAEPVLRMVSILA